MSEQANARLNNYWERIALWAMGVLFMAGTYVVQQQNADIRELEAKVQTIQIDKVSKSDLKELEIRITNEIASTKTDMRELLELYLKPYTRSNER